MEKRRYANIDLIKAIAILMVIILHSGFLKTNFMVSKTIACIIEYACRLISEGVPLFVMVNGFLLLNKKEFELKKHLKKVLKLAILLIIWSILNIVFYSVIWNEPLTFNMLYKNIFTTDIANKYTGVLWFLQNLIMLYLLYPILKYLHDSNKKIYNYLFVLIAINTIGINTLTIIIKLVIQITSINSLNYIITYLSQFNVLNNGYFLLFFMLGGYIYEKQQIFENKNNIIKYSIIGVISWILAFTYGYVMSILMKKTYYDSYNYSTIFMIFILISVFAITSLYKDKKKWYNKLITSIGKNSLGIYLIHKFIISIVDYSNLLLSDNILMRGLKVIVVLFGSLIITIILSKIPKVKELVKI